MNRCSAVVALMLIGWLVAGCSSTDPDKVSRGPEKAWFGGNRVTAAAANQIFYPGFEGFSDERLFRLLDPEEKTSRYLVGTTTPIPFGRLSPSEKERYLRLAFWTANRDYDVELRSQVQDRLIAASNQRCNLFMVYIKRISTYQNGILGSLTTILGGAGAIVTGESATRLLSGLAGISSGIRAELNQATFESLATSVIVPGIQSTREGILKEIMAKRSKSIGEYTIEGAVADAIDYHGACSMNAGIAFAQKSIQSFQDVGLKKVTETLEQLGSASRAAGALKGGPLKSLEVSPTSVQGDASLTAMVTLGQVPSESAPTTVLLVADKTKIAEVPATVTIPAGQLAATFTIKTQAVSARTAVTLSATCIGGARSVTFTVLPASPGAVVLTPSTVQGGAKSSGTVTLSGKAGPEGCVVALGSSDARVATTPFSTKVSAGEVSAQFDVATVPVDASAQVAITAAAPGGSTSAMLSVAVAELSNVAMTTGEPVSGATAKGTITLSSAAGPAGAKVELKSDNANAATVPAQVAVPPGQSSVVFDVTCGNVSTETAVTLTASFGGKTKTALVTVRPPNQ